VIRKICFLAFMLMPGLMWLSACSEGETVPLIPAGAICERPLDQNWKYLTNVQAGKDLFDAVWPEGQMPVVVGQDGLIMECDEFAEWRTINLHFWDDLSVIAANDDGDLVAAGQYGSFAVRTDGHWELQEPMTDSTWKDVRSNGNEMWLAGENGTLAVGTPGQDWQLVDFPFNSNIYGVCAFEDSVFVCDGGLLLKVNAEGQWQEITPPAIQNPITSIVRLDDGRLVLWAYDLWIREPEGWVEVDFANYNLACHLKVRDGFLWHSNYVSTRFDTSVEPWQETRFPAYGNFPSIAPGPSGEALAVTDNGKISWLSQDESQAASRRLDPAGYLDTENLVRLADGTVVFSCDEFLFTITPSGINQVTTLSADVESMLEDDTPLGGASVNDFFLVDDFTLYRIEGGEIVLEAEIPGDYSSVWRLLVDDTGRAGLIASRGILFWNDNQWDVLSDHFLAWLHLTDFQNFIVTTEAQAFYYSADGMITIDLGMPTVMVVESEPGVLDFMNQDYRMVHWEVDTGLDNFFYLDPLPGCDHLELDSLAYSPWGTFIGSISNSMILKIPEDPLRADWDLAAGPCLHSISSFQILDNGTIAALDKHDNFIMIYPSSNF
jgi:hypothetical protein